MSSHATASPDSTHPVRFSLRGPDSLVAAIPYLLGFHPVDSVVMVWIRDQKVALTQRFDLPGSVEDLASQVRSPMALAEAAEADSAVIAIFTGESTDDGSAEQAWRQDLADVLCDALADAEVECLDVLHVAGSRWWSYWCEGSCCPAGGREVDPRVQREVDQVFAADGNPPAASRQAIVAEFADDPVAVAATANVIATLEADLDSRFADAPDAGRALERWREEEIEALRQPFAAADGQVDEPARLIVGLLDVRVRDCLLWYLSRSEWPRDCLGALTGVVRCAGPRYLAPVATCAGIAAWLAGDGVRAATAIERALQDDPDYSLAILVDRSLRHGLPPVAWREVMQRLSLHECRTGESDPAVHAED